MVVQGAEGIGLKGVIKKQWIESTQEAIQAFYSLEEDTSVVATRWAGRNSSKLPLKRPALHKLVKEDDMVYFS